VAFRKPGRLTRFCHNLSNGRISINVYGNAGGRKAVKRWTMKRLQQERSISEALPHNSELWRTKYDTISAAGTSSLPWLPGSSGLRNGLSYRLPKNSAAFLGIVLVGTSRVFGPQADQFNHVWPVFNAKFVRH